MVAGAALSFSTAYAADEALLDTLVTGGYLTQEQASRLLSADAASFSAKGKETEKVRFNGRLQLQYDALNSEADNGDKATTNHFYFRRVFFGAKANLSDNWYAETVLDFAGDEAPELNFDKAIIGYKASNAADFNFGFTKIPFGYEETSSSASIPTIERSATTRFFSDDIDFGSRHTGIHVKGKFDGGFKYAASVGNAYQGEGSRLGGTSSSTTDYILAGRLQWDGDISENVSGTIGIDGAYAADNEVVEDQITAFGIHAALEVYGFKVVAEYLQAEFDESEQDPSGYYITLSYKAGKWEPVFRYSHMDADGFGIDEDELIRRAAAGVSASDQEIDSFYFGVNYHVNKAVKVMVGYEMAETEGDNGAEVEIDGLRARLQLLW